jgi:choice-of-anchor C domain-containing protein
MKKIILFAFAIFFVPTVVFALPSNLIKNGSFENGTAEPAQYFVTLNESDNVSISDWSVVSGGIDYIGGYWVASEGKRSVDMNSLVNGSIISQSFATVIGETYEVTFDFSGNPDTSNSPTLKVLEVKVTGATPQDFTYDTSIKGNSFSDMKWEKRTYTFVAVEETATLTFSSKTTGPCGPVLDNVFVAEKATIVPTLTNPTETEDDGLVDGKGVADKTKFTFSITAIGESEVKLYVDGKVQPTWESTFAKGTHSWYFEANKNGLATTTTETKTFTTGYSNVAFLPGLEASRLYYNNTNCGLLSSCNNTRLWEPNWNNDVVKMYLDENGVSIDSTISTKDPLDTVYGFLGNIYAGFIDSMNDLKSKEIIHEWKPLPYDWRFGFDEILSKGAKIDNGNISYLLGSSTPYIIQETERLARESDTGKVTIIGHSMGGLVAKELTNKLKEKNEGNIVDKVILVASPQSGAPIAIGALLHGEDQALGKGFILNEATARGLAENMQSAYNLLPTQKYFTDVSDKVVTFDATTTRTLSYRNAYGTTIDDTTELYNFLLGTEGRTKPNSQEIWLPNVLNKTVYDRAVIEQTELANWIPPEGAEVIQIAGWGATTVSGIKYVERDCHWYEACTTRLDIEPTKVIDGDGTVPVPSALATAGVESYFVNIPDYNAELFGARTNRSHADILEISQLQTFISNIIQNINSLPIHITRNTPPSDDTRRLNFSLHSPVSLDIYDAQGRHTGLAPFLPNSDIQQIDEQIPNSYYFTFGEGKYAGVDSSVPANVSLHGLSAGSFTLDITTTQGNQTVSDISFTDVPITADTIVTVQNQNTTTPVLNMDIDGDGVNDVVISSGDGVSTQELIGILKGTIKTLGLSQKKQQDLLKKIEKLEKALEKEFKNDHKKKQKTREVFKNIIQKIQQLEKKKLLTADESAQLREIIEQIRKSMIK